jgi:hypothetical protein
MKHILLLLACLHTLLAYGQKHDYIWMFSHAWGESLASELDFNYNPPLSIPVEREMFLNNTNASLGDKDGNLLAYTNGIWIANKLGQMMENGDSLNPGAWADANKEYGYPVPQGAFFLPMPNSPDRYYLFHMFIDLTNDSAPLTKFYYTVVDFNYNMGLGKVLEKNVLLMEGDWLLNFNHATAVRHGNGRDWWVILPHHMKPVYYRFLLTPEGVSGPWEQSGIGFKVPTENFYEYNYGQRIFTLDGSKFADYDQNNYLQLFDFDRCTGLLGNPVLIDHTITANGPSTVAQGVAFSPSGRFLYISRFKDFNEPDADIELVQYDTEANDINASETILASCFSPVPYTCGMSNMLLGPDGKIYIADYDSMAFDVVHHPDAVGNACDFEYGGYEFSVSYPNTWLPYYPNYRLYDVPDSPCDTLGIDAPVTSVDQIKDKGSQIQVFPNPATDVLQLASLSGKPISGKFFLLNNIGQQVRSWHLKAESPTHGMPLDGLPNGIYFWGLKAKDGQVEETGKIIVKR